MTFRESVRTLVLIVGLLGAQSSSASLPATEGEVRVSAEFLSIDRAPGCGYFVFGSPATFRVTSGPGELIGSRIQVLVWCADFYPDLYVVGGSYDLRLSRENVHKVEMPNALPDPSWFYLVEAQPKAFDYAAYAPSDLRSALKEAGINPAMDFWLDASHPRIRTEATFTGKTRAIKTKATELITHWGVAMGHGKQAADIFQHEVQIRQSGRLYWMPIQSMLEPAFKEEVVAGQEVSLFLLLVGAYDGVPVFTIAAFGPAQSDSVK
jgi:hypothetical protein